MLCLCSRESVVWVNEGKWDLIMKNNFRNNESTSEDLRKQRSKVAKYVKLGKRTGYSLWLIAIILFFGLFFTDFDIFVTIFVRNFFIMHYNNYS